MIPGVSRIIPDCVVAISFVRTDQAHRASRLEFARSAGALAGPAAWLRVRSLVGFVALQRSGRA